MLVELEMPFNALFFSMVRSQICIWDGQKSRKEELEQLRVTTKARKNVKTPKNTITTGQKPNRTKVKKYGHLIENDVCV